MQCSWPPPPLRFHHQMTVYLEQIGIANEVAMFFGVDKFRLVSRCKAGNYGSQGIWAGSS